MFCIDESLLQYKKASNHHANLLTDLLLEMYSFTL